MTAEQLAINIEIAKALGYRYELNEDYWDGCIVDSDGEFFGDHATWLPRDESEAWAYMYSDKAIFEAWENHEDTLPDWANSIDACEKLLEKSDDFCVVRDSEKGYIAEITWGIITGVFAGEYIAGSGATRAEAIARTTLEYLKMKQQKGL
jgi:hypothetical protein